MKICIATNKGGLDDDISPLFGRCANFTFVEVNEVAIGKVTISPNQAMRAMGGAGIQASQFIVDSGAKAIIAGNFGPNAHPILNNAGVEAITAQGNVKEVIEKYIRGELKASSGPSAPAKFGGQGMGQGRGRMRE